MEDAYTLESERSPKVDYYSQEKNRQAASERQEQFRKRVSIQHAVGEDVPRAFSKQTVESPKQKSSQPENVSAGIFRQGILLAIAAILTSILAVSVLAPAFCKRVIAKLKPWNSMKVTPTGAADKVRAEDEYFAEFLTAFQAGNAAGTAAVNAGRDSGNGIDAERQGF